MIGFRVYGRLGFRDKDFKYIQLPLSGSIVNDRV